MEIENLIDIYKSAVVEHRSIAADHHKRIAWFMSIITAIGAATITGLFKSSKWYHFISLSIGPFVMIEIAKIAVDATERLNRRFLECITFRAKLECSLGLMSPRESKKNTCPEILLREPFVPERHIESFKVSSIEEWTEKMEREGYQFEVERIFEGSKKISVLLLILILLSLIYHIVSIFFPFLSKF